VSRTQALFRSKGCDAGIAVMATLTIRQVDEETKARLRLRAARHSRSMEAEAREILRAALSRAQPRAKFGRGYPAAVCRRGGVELELPARDAVRPPPDLTA
jgi:plasmid stability protein